MGFQYPNLTTFLSLMPESRQPELVNSMPPSELGELLRRPDIVDDEPISETLPEAVGRQTLPCVWPTALSSTERSEVDAWFDRRLPNYLGFLTKDLLTSGATQNASCLAFQRLVSTLAMHDYADADFTTRDVYRCHQVLPDFRNGAQVLQRKRPELNSTAWFVEYIGAFTPFLTLNDLNTFGPVQISAALAANFGDELTTDAIAALSEESATSISAGQINAASPQVLLASLGILSSATGWNQGQALAIVQALTSSGELQHLGHRADQRFQDPTFLTHFISAPTIVQQTFVNQIISVNSSSTAIIDNVPDALATEIPRFFLVFSSTTVVMRLNRKTWRKQQRKWSEPTKEKKDEKRNKASIRSRRTRAADEECTSGAITQVTISDATFPFDYTTAAQFNSCLSATTTRDNLAAITQAVDDTEYLRIVLDKLQEAYASTSSIPEDQVKVLGPASRTATSEDISMWNITQIDTLSDLMNSANGEWDPTLAEAIISKYLTRPGNSLGTAELNQIGGANLCALSVSVLRNISANSIRNANELTITNCSIENKRALFTIAQVAFSATRAVMVPITEFQLITSYLGGADSSYINRLADSGVNMDLPTFTSLDPEVVPSLTVPQVRGLLGSNTDDLTAYKDDPVVQDWASRQSQTDLDGLVSGLTGRAVASTTTPAATTAGGTTAGGTTASGTTAGGNTAGGTTASGNYSRWNHCQRNHSCNHSQWNNSYWNHSQWNHSRWNHSWWKHSCWSHSRWNHSFCNSSQWSHACCNHSRWKHSCWSHSRWKHSCWSHSRWKHSCWSHSRWKHSCWSHSWWKHSCWGHSRSNNSCWSHSWSNHSCWSHSRWNHSCWSHSRSYHSCWYSSCWNHSCPSGWNHDNHHDNHHYHHHYSFRW
ncbi:uncharacterized protein LOC115540788 [Gadus morhua]|uniref:uncharacterized protein LOC115540788 n=1 Tax=Gadus morhua TaxID=8049 RepID=UPI0011B50CA4|nr:mesothelin [Gadus morhua]